MKSKNSRPALGSLLFHAIGVACCVFAFGPVALALLFAPVGASPTLGVAYNRPNVTSKSDLTGQTAKVEEELWVRRVVLGADAQYQDNPFSDGFMGDPESGKAIIKITDTEKVHGTTINVPTVAGFGGPGVAGAGDRIGNEQKIQVGNFPVKIGRFWFGVGFQAVARDETVIGGRLDSIITRGLRTLHAKKRNDDILMKILQIPATATGFRNLIRPDGVATRAALKSANTMDTPTITLAGNALSSLSALPMRVGVKDSGGSEHEEFIVFGTHHSMASLDIDPAYLDAVTNSGERGKGNPNFRGGYQRWNGHGIYRWHMRDHGNWGPVGSPLQARAFLGVALAGANTGSVIQGGGNPTAAAVTPAPQYFEFFLNSPYTFHDNSVIAADVATTRYLLIINSDGSGWNCYSYKVNNGNQITIFARVVLGLAGETATFNHPAGSLVVQAEANGTTWARSLMFGQEMMVCGQGSINGNPASPQMGKRTEEHRNHDMDHGIGAENVWGCAAVQRADNVYPGVVIVEHAVTVPGAPVVT